MNFRQNLRNAIIKPVGVLIGFTVVFIALSHFYTPTFTVDRNDSPNLPDPRGERIERMIEAHDCYTDDAPKGTIPGHAVVTHHGGHLAYVKSDEGFAIWLGDDGKAGTGDEQAGVIHAFCP